MPTPTTPNLPDPAGATYVADWDDVEFGIDHASRYFSGSSWVVERGDQDRDIIVQIDGTQGADGSVTRRIMVFDGNREAIELSGAHSARLGAVLTAAADQAVKLSNAALDNSSSMGIKPVQMQIVPGKSENQHDIDDRP